MATREFRRTPARKCLYRVSKLVSFAISTKISLDPASCELMGLILVRQTLAELCERNLQTLPSRKVTGSLPPGQWDFQPRTTKELTHTEGTLGIGAWPHPVGIPGETGVPGTEIPCLLLGSNLEVPPQNCFAQPVCAFFLPRLHSFDQIFRHALTPHDPFRIAPNAEACSTPGPRRARLDDHGYR